MFRADIVYVCGMWKDRDTGLQFHNVEMTSLQRRQQFRALWGRLYDTVVTYVDTQKKYVDIKLICAYQSNLLCFRHLSESGILLGALHRKMQFPKFCHDLMENHLS